MNDLPEVRSRLDQPPRLHAVPAPLLLDTPVSFDTACTLVLDYLREHVPLGFWSVTRAENGRQTYLALGENVYGLLQGGSHPWEDSYCVHMTAGRGPVVAPDAQSVPVYAAAKVNESVRIGAYAGAPICDADGELFGALCGLDPEPQSPELAHVGPLLTLLGQLLSMVLVADRARADAARDAAIALTDATTDALTGLLNRRGWDLAVAAEQARFSRFADPTVVVAVDLDHLKAVNDGPGGHAAGDRHLVAAARVLREAVRAHDTLARLGGDEFALILPGCSTEEAPLLTHRLDAALRAAGVPGSVGWAPVTLVAGVTDALRAADEAMYGIKRERHGRCGLPRPADGDGVVEAVVSAG
ncbi:MAG: GGDEF domain-containing protein [Motilibacteraceae bacterium]